MDDGYNTNIDKRVINSVNQIGHSRYFKYFRSKVLEVARTLDKKYIFCEIGTFSGKTAFILLDAIKKSNNKRWLFTVDPYGDKLYEGTTESIESKRKPVLYNYNDQHYRNAMLTLHKYAFDNNLLYSHWRMTSKDFMTYAESIKFWHDGKQIDYKFGLVFLDGEHYEDIVLKEFNWFNERLVNGGIIIIDDISYIWRKVKKIPDEDKIKKIFDGKNITINENKLYYEKT